MSGSDDDEIVFVGETRDGGALEGDARDAKRVRYDASNSLALATETPARTEIAPDPSSERHAPPLFRLFRTENTHNEACVSVSDLVRGPVVWAVVSNFKIELDFMQDHAPELLAIPRVHWLHGQDDLPVWIEKHCPNKTDSGDWTTLKPAVPQWGTHHSKFFLLVFKEGCRVVVHTANLCFGDLSVMSNAAWWQDFPKKSPAKTNAHATSEFEEDLTRYLHRTGWRGRDEGDRGHVGPEAFRAFDFEGAGAKLIGSVPGRHGGADARDRRETSAWGHPALRRALEKMPPFPRVFQNAPIIAQASSFGSFTEKWLVDEFGASLNAGRVENGSETKEPRAAGGAAGESSRFSTASPSKESSLGEGPIQLVWPTVSEVRSSLLGYAAGGSIPGNTRNLAKPHVAARLHAWRALGESRKTEPKTDTSSSRDSAYSSNRHPYGRERAVPHIKTYTRYALRSDGPPKLAWVFLGSHNLSGAAWGKFEKNQTQLNVLSYELGVLLAPNLVGPRNEKSPFCAVAASLASVAPFSDSAVSAASKRFLCLAGARPRKSASDEHRKASTSAVEFRHARCVNEWSRGGKKTDDAPLPGDDDDAKKSDDADFDFVVAPLPYPVPPRRYGLGDTPWTIDTVHAEPDVFERTWPM